MSKKPAQVTLADLAVRLDRIESALRSLVTGEREWYSVEEFASITKKAEFTVREYCRLGRLNAKKKKSGRGAYSSWVISHAELVRYQRDGLLAWVRAGS